MLYSSLRKSSRNKSSRYPSVSTEIFTRGGWRSTIGVFLGLLLPFASPQAHLLGESYAFVRFADDALFLRTDMPIERLDEALGTDSVQEPMLTAEQVEARIEEIVAYIESRLTLAAPDTRYAPRYVDHEAWSTPKGHYLSVHFYQPNVGVQPDEMEARYEMFLDIDPEHRGILELLPPEATESNAEKGRILAVFAPGRTLQRVRLDPESPAAARAPIPKPSRRGALLAAMSLAVCSIIAVAITAGSRTR